MARYTKRQYNLQVAATMAVYMLLVVFEFPFALKAPAAWERVVLAVLPALPIVVVIALMARYVASSDELMQRIHLIALSVATGVVSVASAVVGFLVFAKVLTLDGGIVFWVFPALAVGYGIARAAAARHFTGSWTFWGC